MKENRYQTLTDTQVAHFLDRGFIILQNCFSADLAAEWRALAFKRLGYDPANASTWKEARTHLPTMNRMKIRDLAPSAWGAICDLLGGEERIANPDAAWGDGFIINFSIGADQPWIPPSPPINGWHKDGDFFKHFLNSPEQGLLTIVIWSDILPRSGGTFIACDSVGHIARMLADHPEGLYPNAGFGKVVQQCSDFVELTGKAGDVVLLHPFMIHSHSHNPSGRPRFITNPPVALREPMRFDRTPFEAHSPVEMAVLKALGVEQHTFEQTTPSERLHPERERIQARMLEEQKQRLGVS